MLNYRSKNKAKITFLSKSLFREPTWFCVVHPNLDPTLIWFYIDFRTRCYVKDPNLTTNA